jgi:predicted secreted Zn-dependent protease
VKRICSAFLMLLLAFPATAEMTLKARQTVDVYGSSALEPSLADVDYRLSWQLTGEQSEQGCRPAQVLVSLTATVTEPLEWPQTPAWQNYRLALTAYERLVRERALLSGEWLERSLFEIAAQSNCDQLRQVADNVGYHQLDIARTLLQDFQQQSDYGRNLGLIRPE